MILPWIIIIFFGGGLLAWFSQRWGPLWPRLVSIAVLVGQMGLLIYLWLQYFNGSDITNRGPWVIQFNRPWIAQLGISFHLGLDGISFLLIVLASILGIMAVAASWTMIQDRVGFFHFNLMWLLAAIAAIFLALDLFLFYFTWEVILVPLFFLIAIWGHERRIYAAIKFFIFTQASGLLMLVAIIGLYLIHGRNTGTFTFDYSELLGTVMSESTATLLMLGLFAAFAVKLPVVPLHSWLPDAHTQAPTAGSVDLAGLVLKVGAYGMLRFLIPLFPKAALDFTPIAMGLAILGIIYGAIVAFGQTDLKRLVAYTSISHMGFVLLGIFAWNQYALEGALIIMLMHGISTSGLFILVGDLYERVHTRDMNHLSGLWSKMPIMGGSALIFAMASLGLPGLGNFVGEFLVLLGTYQVNPPAAALATLGFIVSTVYSLWIIQRVFHGPLQEANRKDWKLFDSTAREAIIMAILIVIIIWVGLFPQTILNTGRRALEDLQRYTTQLQPAAVSTSVTPTDLPSLNDMGGVQGIPSQGGQP
jgi:NADH-quinone oxidoreductase subunit M